jgi:hypothetical protein
VSLFSGTPRNVLLSREKWRVGWQCSVDDTSARTPARTHAVTCIQLFSLSYRRGRAAAGRLAALRRLVRKWWICVSGCEKFVYFIPGTAKCVLAVHIYSDSGNRTWQFVYSFMCASRGKVIPDSANNCVCTLQRVVCPAQGASLQTDWLFDVRVVSELKRKYEYFLLHIVYPYHQQTSINGLLLYTFHYHLLFGLPLCHSPLVLLHSHMMQRWAQRYIHCTVLCSYYGGANSVTFCCWCSWSCFNMAISTAAFVYSLYLYLQFRFVFLSPYLAFLPPSPTCRHQKL